MMNKTRLFASLLIFTLLFPFPTSAREVTSTSVTSDGISIIVKSNTAKAREKTIDDALKKAVEQVIGTMLSSETIQQHSETLDDRIYSHAKGYVQNFTVLSEKVTGNLYQVTVQATIAPEILKNELTRLGLIISSKNLPKVLIMVSENNSKTDDSLYWWGRGDDKLTVTEQTLIAKLLEKGFTVINHLSGREENDIPEEYRNDSLSDGAIKEIGSLFGADLVIYGKALASFMDFTTNRDIVTAQADISLKAVNTSDVKLVATAINHESAAHINDYYAGAEALKKATDAVSERFLTKIVKNWSKTESKGNAIKMVISGIKSYTDFMNFKDVLQNKVRGVRGVSQRGFSSGVATLNVELEGSAQNLADNLTLISYEGFAIDITGITERGMQIRLRPR
ncbi:MAG: flagellar assembly protein T N-terminal domain-containing protein [Proteobacteria bacterium]|nr:flagellar assembly protein T N-terminal domain-containing protein [Pseudomonadota bacterium]